MKLKRRLLSVIITLTLLAGIIPAKTEKTAKAAVPTAAEIAADMGLGWNLGNTLDAHFSGQHQGNESETCWGMPETTKDTILAVKAKGFNTIRVPVTWYNHMDSENKVDASWMARVKEVVNYAYDEGMYVILNIHHEEWNRPTESNYSAASAKLKTLWNQIAKEFKNYDYHLVFEGMNEPRNYNGSDEWNGGTSAMRTVVNKLNKDFVETVRATGGNNSTRALMLPTYAASSDYNAMNEWSNLSGDSNVIVSVHAYAPYYFAMQDQYLEFNSQMENELASLFANIKKIFIDKGYPVCIGEFSASNHNNTSERVKWAASYAAKAHTLDIPIVLWDNNQPNNSDKAESHGYLNRNSLAWYDVGEPVVDKLAEVYGASQEEFYPTEVFGGGSGEELKTDKDGHYAVSNEMLDYEDGYFEINYDSTANWDSIAIVYSKIAGDSWNNSLRYYHEIGSNLIFKITTAEIREGMGISSPCNLVGASLQGWNGASDTTTINSVKFFKSSEVETGKTYLQKTSVKDGKYSARAFMLISEAEAAKTEKVNITFGNGSSEATVSSTLSFTKIKAEKKYLAAPEGYVFVGYSVKNIPESVDITAKITLVK